MITVGELFAGIDDRNPSPAWVRCENCSDFYCTFHKRHAHDCECPSLETWNDVGLSPYDEPHPGDDFFRT